MNLTFKRSKEKTTFTESVKWGAILFIAVSIIGFAIAYTIKSFTSIGEYASALNRFDTEALRSIKTSTGEVKTLGIMSIASVVLIVISSVMNMMFMFRLNKISESMVVATLGFFVVAQGVGFGILFLSFNAIELMSIFAIAGGIFGIIAIGSKHVKSMNWAWPVLIFGGIAIFFMSMISLVLFFTGVYSDKLILWINIFSSVLTVIWTLYDFWRIRGFSAYLEWDQMSDRDKFVYPKFFGYRLASDLIAIIWRLAYFLLRSQR